MRRSRFLLTVALAVCCATVCLTVPVAAVKYTPAALADKIDNLPGLVQQPSFNQFAGYLVVNETSQKSIFYWYVESQNAPATDPLLWWSNGGPGCSGLLGFMNEHGPFRPAAADSPNAGGLEPFAFAWNTMANVLYVEAPVGVGFSFTNDSSQYTIGDDQTAADNHEAIRQFFQRFPHLQANDFYISAESYGGHYVPTLAKSIVEADDLANFRGFLVGNPLTDQWENTNGQGATICGHALASRPTCNTFATHCLGPNGPDAQCANAQSNVVAEAGGLDLYGLDFPTCPQPQPLLKARMLQAQYSQRMHAPGFNRKLRAQLERLNAAPIPDYNACGINEETAYLNREDVRQALHVNPSVGPWIGCSTTTQYNQSDWLVPMQPIYTELLASGRNLRMVVFSGDDDSICATLGTQTWMFDLLGQEVVEDWTQWTYESSAYGEQIGGSLVQFKGISLVTVHGAGHQVSMYRPQKGLMVLANFLNGTFTSASQPQPQPNEQRDVRKPISLLPPSPSVKRAKSAVPMHPRMSSSSDTVHLSVYASGSCSGASTDVPIRLSQVNTCLPTPSAMSAAGVASMQLVSYDFNSAAYVIATFTDARCGTLLSVYRELGAACIGQIDYALQIVPQYAPGQYQITWAATANDCANPEAIAPITPNVCSQTTIFDLTSTTSQFLAIAANGQSFNMTGFSDTACNNPIGSIIGAFDQCTPLENNIPSMQISKPANMAMAGASITPRRSPSSKQQAVRQARTPPKQLQALQAADGARVLTHGWSSFQGVPSLQINMPSKVEADLLALA